MKLTTIAGSDDVLVTLRVAQIIEGIGDLERIDLDTDPLSRLLDVIASDSLFTPSRNVILTHLSATHPALELLEKYATTSTASVVATFTGPLSPKAQTRLERLGDFEKVLSPTKTADQIAVLSSLAQSADVTLTPPQKAVMVERTNGDWARCQSILTQLALLEGAPSDELLAALLGSSAKEVAAWDVTDATSRGDLALALNLAAQLEPVPLANWICGETLRIVRAHEERLSPAVAASVLKVHPFRAQKIVAWASGIDDAQAQRMLRTAALVELAAKDNEAKERTLSALAAWSNAARPRR